MQRKKPNLYSNRNMIYLGLLLLEVGYLAENDLNLQFLLIQ